MRGGVPTLSLTQKGTPTWMQKNPKDNARKGKNVERGRAVYTVQGTQEDTLKRKKAKRGANVRSG